MRKIDLDGRDTSRAWNRLFFISISSFAYSGNLLKCLVLFDWFVPCQVIIVRIVACSGCWFSRQANARGCVALPSDLLLCLCLPCSILVLFALTCFLALFCFAGCFALWPVALFCSVLLAFVPWVTGSVWRWFYQYMICRGLDVISKI